MKNYLLTILGLLLFVAIAIAFFFLLREIIYTPSIVLTSQECEPPCWKGIQPGVTSAAETTNTLFEIEGINVDSISVITGTTSGDIEQINWSFITPVRDLSGSVYLADQRVSVITLFTINSLKLSAVFDRFGEPELIWLEVELSKYREILEIYYIYPATGLLIESVIDLKAGTSQVEIKENTQVYRVAYFNPDKYNELLDSRILIRRPLHARKNNPQPWAGFGVYQFTRE